MNFKTRKSELVFIFGIIGSIVFGISSIWIFIKLFDENLGLIINEEGIIDNSNAGSIGLIEWTDIVEIKRVKIFSVSILLVILRNPQKYLQHKSIFKRMSLKQNFSNYGTPIYLTSVVLDCSFDELERIVNEAFIKFKEKEV